MLSGHLRADTVVFDFNNDTAFDGNATAGDTMSATGMTDTVVATSVGVFAPEFIEPAKRELHVLFLLAGLSFRR